MELAFLKQIKDFLIDTKSKTFEEDELKEANRAYKALLRNQVN